MQPQTNIPINDTQLNRPHSRKIKRAFAHKRRLTFPLQPTLLPSLPSPPSFSLPPGRGSPLGHGDPPSSDVAQAHTTAPSAVCTSHHAGDPDWRFSFYSQSRGPRGPASPATAPPRPPHSRTNETEGIGIHTHILTCTTMLSGNPNHPIRTL